MNNYTDAPSYIQDLESWHPVKAYYEENNYIRNLLNEFKSASVDEDQQKFINTFHELMNIDKRYARKENQLFPYLEKRGWNGPSQGMWAFHDANRDIIREINKKLNDKDYAELSTLKGILISELTRLMNVEEFRLFPYALELLTHDDWREMSEGDDEIGWMHQQSSKIEKKGFDKDNTISNVNSSDNLVNLEVGSLTPEQLNLMLKFMPIDLTYVDENDRVKFYNRGEDRVFPRSPGVIGREVRFCHPPKSVDTVLRIVEAFRRGEKDSAEFWINYRGKVIHIRYFAIRDKQNIYRGVIELSQDITEIQKLSGEQRLLSWDA